MIPKHEIVLALTSDDGAVRGNIWKITAKKTDFYLEFTGRENGGIHLSAHGPNERFESHRFHIKTDPRKAQRARDKGMFFEKTLDKGVEVKGIQIAEHAYHVARLRWTWELQRPRYRHAAVSELQRPQLNDSRDGKILKTRIKPNQAWDIDLVVSYGGPYWLTDAFWWKQKQIGPHSPKLGPLKNNAGMYLTGTSIHRSLTKEPGPAEHLLPRPRNDEDAQALTSGNFGVGKLRDLYWFEERIVAKGFPQDYDFEVVDDE